MCGNKWYPYPFTDVVTLGYQIVLRNAVGITVLLLGAVHVRRRLPRGSR
jgi:hypothetical protein